MTTGDPVCPVCGGIAPHFHDTDGIIHPWPITSFQDDGFIRCPHIKPDSYTAHVLIEIGDKRLILCSMCDNTLRGHYIGDLTKLTVNLRGRL